MINETYCAIVQGFPPSPARPDVDGNVPEGLTTTILDDQERLGNDRRSTIGTATDTGALLHILSSRLGQRHAGGPKAESLDVASVSGSGAITLTEGSTEKREFSITGGMCISCQGRGSITDSDLDELFDPDLSLAAGALEVPGSMGIPSPMSRP